ncbi:hypothetical protein KIW84_062008 [Lathyrus oleraceus]|uniref:Arabidopsis retrotransposon Orf1 C-terminal domain-containing protein n=1 Tax=Pisum sativum TaxID=3888 RepID=A0A9D4W4P5_PEA|nr:hypothetical protein KIW84_062008 [Pisum sativum]
MFNRSNTVNQDQLVDLLSFPHGDDFACQHPLESKWESSALDFWQQLTRKTNTNWEGLKATSIQNPTIWYLHRILAITIVGRENTGNVNSRDLFIIYCALFGTKVNPTPFLLAHFQSTSVWTRGTSSGYQPCEEYDYTAMRTTLDDVLSELRYQNDAEADRDVILRNIQRQQEEIRVSIDQIRQTQLDFVERIELNIADLIENMNGVHMEAASMREYMQHVPNPAFGRGGFARHRGRVQHH